jgi:hypothetical protein
MAFYWEKRNTADAIAVLTLAVEYSLTIVIAKAVFGRAFPWVIFAVIFPVFAGIAVAIFHVKEEKLSSATWGWLALLSPGAGLAFFGVDWLEAFLHGESNPLRYHGSPLGLPLTILVCPVGTTVLVAGFARALWIKKTESGSENGPTHSPGGRSTP